MRNLVAQDVLVLVNGAFADRWYKVGVANGKAVDRPEVIDWGVTGIDHTNEERMEPYNTPVMVKEWLEKSGAEGKAVLDAYNKP